MYFIFSLIGYLSTWNFSVSFFPYRWNIRCYFQVTYQPLILKEPIETDEADWKSDKQFSTTWGRHICIFCYQSMANSYLGWLKVQNCMNLRNYSPEFIRRRYYLQLPNVNIWPALSTSQLSDTTNFQFCPTVDPTCQKATVHVATFCNMRAARNELSTTWILFIIIQLLHAMP